MAEETTVSKKLSPEAEAIAAYGSATVAALQVMVVCLQETGALARGQYPESLRIYMEMTKHRDGPESDMTLAILHDLRMSLLD
jgi:hypothetical protein